MKLLIPAAIFIFLVSCKSENKEQVGAPSVSPITTNPFSPAGNDSLAAGVTLNPEHGKPGHRCELAVGAPLPGSSTNNSIAPTVAPATFPANVETKTVAPSTNTSTTSAITLNPQHGQPGHRCDIAVGAPLNSKPN